MLEGDGEVALTADGDGLSVLILAGRPLNEPIARYGPFVMSSPQEIHDAIDDYRTGRMGQL